MILCELVKHSVSKLYGISRSHFICNSSFAPADKSGVGRIRYKINDKRYNYNIEYNYKFDHKLIIFLKVIIHKNILKYFRCF